MIKHLLQAVILALFLHGFAFSQYGLEIDAGLSSPNKGLLGVRFYPSPTLSAGVILGSFASYGDFAVAASYHVYGHTGLYIFQSHHWLSADKGSVQNLWEINTGAGVQYVQYAGPKGFLGYVELGIPLYIGGGRVYRNYEGGIPNNRNSDGEMVVVSFRLGLGIGYLFEL
jgi:hypothetical protein